MTDSVTRAECPTAAPPESLSENLLDALRHLGRVAVAGQVDQTVHEPVPRVAMAEQPHLSALAEGRDTFDDRVQLVDARVEQGIARIGVERCQQGLVPMAGGAVAGTMKDLDGFGDQDRDPGDRLGVGRGRQHADEPPLAHDRAGLVEDAYPPRSRGTRCDAPETVQSPW